MQHLFLSGDDGRNIVQLHQTYSPASANPLQRIRARNYTSDCNRLLAAVNGKPNVVELIVYEVTSSSNNIKPTISYYIRGHACRI